MLGYVFERSLFVFNKDPQGYIRLFLLDSAYALIKVSLAHRQNLQGYASLKQDIQGYAARNPNILTHVHGYARIPRGFKTSGLENWISILRKDVQG